MLRMPRLCLCLKSESVPPKNYGGIERVASYLTEELVRRGHQVTLFATSDSQTSAELIAKWPSLRTHPIGDEQAAYRWMFAQVRARHSDILHFHTHLNLKMHEKFDDDTNRTAQMMTLHRDIKYIEITLNWAPLSTRTSGPFPYLTISGITPSLNNHHISLAHPFLGNALAFLFPISWAEPFGMVMVEAMACGTPVLARRRGSVPEVLDEGISGLTFETIEEAVDVLQIIQQMDRTAVRAAFERRFTARTMADAPPVKFEIL